MSYALGGGNLNTDDLDRASRDAGIRDRALAWYRKAEPEIAAMAGREATAAEKAIAQVIIMAELGAKMYGDIRKEFGAPTAQELLRQAFTMVGGVMRRNGESVHMRLTTDFSDVAATEKQKALCEHEADESCDCALDQDGRCAYCMETFQSFCSKMGESVRIIREANLTNRKLCRPCVSRHMDVAMAEFVRRDLSKVDRDTAEAMMKTVFMTSQSMQAMPMPITMKAWDEIIKDPGRS